MSVPQYFADSIIDIPPTESFTTRSTERLGLGLGLKLILEFGFGLGLESLLNFFWGKRTHRGKTSITSADVERRKKMKNMKAT